MGNTTVNAEVHSYRVVIEVPKTARAGTTWRTLAVRHSYAEVGDLAGYLVDSMVLAGIDRAVARAWASTRLKCVPQVTTTTRSEPEGMPIGP